MRTLILFVMFLVVLGWFVVVANKIITSRNK